MSPVTTVTTHNHPIQLQVSFHGFSQLPVFHGTRLVFIGFSRFQVGVSGSRWVFVVICGSRSVFQLQVGFSGFQVGFSRFQVGFSWFQVGFIIFHCSRLVFHGSRSVFIVIRGSGLLWVFKVPGWFFIVPGWFS